MKLKKSVGLKVKAKASVKAKLPRKIVLIGMRGTGKTSIGKELANLLKIDFLDMDHEIEQMAGKKIREIVDESGWDFFRDLEHEIAKKVAGMKFGVVATGGGAVTFERNQEFLRSGSKVVHLQCDLSEIAKRIFGDLNRPSLTEQDDLLSELSKTWQKRKEAYEKSSDLAYSTDNGKSVRAQAAELFELLEG
jgi:shikimate kinase